MPTSTPTFRLLLLACATALLLHACADRTPPTEPQVPANPADLIDPFIGTGGHGHTFPGATVPFGMVQLSPDTRLEGWDGCSGYHFSDSVIYGFSHTHLSGTGVSDYGDVLFMPMSEPAWESKVVPGERSYPSRFEKSSEKAGGGWYNVHLEQGNVDVELTATTRCGYHRYTFARDSGLVLIDLNHRDILLGSALKVVNATEVEGYRASTAWARDQQVYFVAQFSAPIQQHETRAATKNADQTPLPTRYLLHFDSLKDRQLIIRVGLSSVSVADARRALEVEGDTWDFDTVRENAKQAWKQQVSKIIVGGGTPEQQKIFYTALYHTSIVPNVFSGVDGDYMGMDRKPHSAGVDQQYTVFSLWDTYRATHPLYTLIEQKRNTDFIRSFLRMYQEGGRLPVWELAGNETECMIGYHSVAVIADAYMKGLRDFDAELALQAMVHSADMDHFGLATYKSQGHIGAGDESESVSKTLEYAYDDWCIAEMAHAMGRDSIATQFYQRAQYYKNLFDPGTGFFRAKMNGCWQEPFDPREVNFNFTEANAWQYSLAVPQDIEGLIALMGGKQAFEAHLDKLFTAETATTGREQADITGLIGQYAHGNEPSHHMAWLYNFTDSPHKVQMYVSRILAEMYHAAPDGLSGNEDCGQMSAWYVMSAMGLYAVTPGRPEYHLSAPLFPYVRLNLENRNIFEIKAEGVDKGKKYIQTATLNGEPVQSLVISQQAIMAGGELVFVMGEQPNDKWAGQNPMRPESKINGPRIATVPYFRARTQTFTDTLVVRIASVEPGVTIHFTMDGNLPTKASPTYSTPMLIQEQTVFQAIGIAADGSQSPVARAEFYKIDPNRKIKLLTKYENQYAAGGENALIDGLRGGPNFRTGRWQGYQGDMEVVVDLGKSGLISGVSVGFLQDIGSWIWMPRQVEFSFSEDGKTFGSPTVVPSKVADKVTVAIMTDYQFETVKPLHTRYVRVKAINYGICPPWHLGAGGQAWIFADEVVVEGLGN